MSSWAGTFVLVCVSPLPSCPFLFFLCRMRFRLRQRGCRGLLQGEGAAPGLTSRGLLVDTSRKSPVPSAPGAPRSARPALPERMPLWGRRLPRKRPQRWGKPSTNATQSKRESTRSSRLGSPGRDRVSGFLSSQYHCDTSDRCRPMCPRGWREGLTVCRSFSLPDAVLDPVSL